MSVCICVLVTRELILNGRNNKQMNVDELKASFTSSVGGENQADRHRDTFLSKGLNTVDR